MTFKEALKELKKDPRNGLYFIQGHLRWLIHSRAIKQYYKKSKECPECFHLNQCEKCGCNFNAVALTNKCKLYGRK